MNVLIVDCYNIINYWPRLAELAKDNLEDARMHLLDYLSNYQGYKQIRVIAVFDAHMVSGGEKALMHDKIEVIFTKEGQSADNYIERLVRELSKNNHVIVATSDFLQQTLILGGGATRLSARELVAELEKQNKVLDNMKLLHSVKKNYIEANLEPEVRAFLDKLRNKE